MICIRVLSHPTSKPGDPAPTDYLAWHDWAWVQHQEGQMQVRCGRCLKYWFPQALIGHRCVTL